MMRRALRTLDLRAAGAALLVLLLATAASPSAEADEAYPALAPVTADRLDALVAERRGRVVVLNYWATWCGPCRREFPELAKLRDYFSKDELAVVSVSLDFDRDMLRTFIRENPFPYPVYFAGPGLMDDKDIDAIPRTLLFAPDGREVQNHDGPITFEELRAAATPLLAAPEKETR